MDFYLERVAECRRLQGHGVELHSTASYWLDHAWRTAILWAELGGDSSSAPTEPRFVVAEVSP